jgi:hypothetical protein
MHPIAQLLSVGITTHALSPPPRTSSNRAAVMPLSCIRQMFGSNLDQDIIYPDWFSWFSAGPSDKCPDITASPRILRVILPFNAVESSVA